MRSFMRCCRTVATRFSTTSHTQIGKVVTSTIPHDVLCNVEDAESLHRYCWGGYHPVHLGDKFKDNQYEVLHKLGYGGYSTVWLARDNLFHRYVALKICVAERHRDDRELRTLKHLAKVSSPSSPDLRHVVRMFDHFQTTGPNGSHDCIVLELLGASLPKLIEEGFRGERLPGHIAKAVSKQVLLALEFLHRNYVAHGDLHIGNVACTIPDINNLEKDDLIESLGQPEQSPVFRNDGVSIGPHLPRYLVWPCRLPSPRSLKDIHINVIDFGESFVPGNRPETLRTPLVIRAPEVVLDDDWDYPVDLWTAGCLISELVVGQPPFDNLFITRGSLVKQMNDMIGQLPEPWKQKGVSLQQADPPTSWYKENEENDDTEETKLNLQQWLGEIYFADRGPQDFDGRQIEELGQLLGRFMRFDPSSRISAEEALQQPFFRENNVQQLPSPGGSESS